MRILSWAGAGLAGGILGAVAWALVAAFWNVELGILAWGIGLLAGVGVRWAAGDAHGEGPGIVAVLVAVLAIFAGKLGAVAVVLNQDLALGAYDVVEDRDYLVSFLADAQIREKISRGEQVHWPAGAVPFEGSGPDDYPPDNWASAEQEWAAMSGPERLAFAKDPFVFSDAEFLISLLADEIAADYENAGMKLNWPNGDDGFSAQREEDYPPEIWAAAVDRWNRMSVEERRELSSMPAFEFLGALVAAIFLLPMTLGLFDLLWFGLAVFTAYRVGSGASHDV